MEQTQLSAMSEQLADAVASAGKSIVTVNGRDRQSASGIIFAADSVLTADHVLEREDNLSVVTHDGRKLDAQFVGRDPATDLAVLRVPNLGLPPIAMAPVARVGQLALAVGRPDDGGAQASMGIVSQTGGPIRIGRGAQLEKFIRTDATPYPGFSGGPLIDVNGAAYGVLTTGLLRGVPLVIPSDVAVAVAQMLARGGSIKRGYLGLVTQGVKLSPSQRAAGQDSGLLVMRVEDGSPAERGGLIVGDILLAIDGNAVRDADELLALLTGERVGKSVPVTVLRGGAAATLSVTVAERR